MSAMVTRCYYKRELCLLQDIDLKFSFAGWKCNGSIELQRGYLGLTSNKVSKPLSAKDSVSFELKYFCSRQVWSLLYIYFCISKAHWSHLCSVQGESIKDTCKASVSTASSALIDQIFQQFLEHLVSKYVQSLSWPVCFAHRSRLMFSHAFQTVQHAGETW